MNNKFIRCQHKVEYPASMNPDFFFIKMNDVIYGT